MSSAGSEIRCGKQAPHRRGLLQASLRRGFLITTALGGFSLSPQAAFALDIVVTNLNDAGAGSLRAAITSINGSSDLANSISFANGVTGQITLQSDLPTITKPVAIDFINNVGAASTTLGGNFGLGVASAGLVTMNTAHDYTGTTTLASGTLSVASPNHGLNFAHFGSTRSLLVMGSGTTFNVPSNTTASFSNLSGSGTITNNGFGQGILLVGGDTTPRTFAGTISGTGMLSMWGGGEKLTLSGSTTYSGMTFLAGSIDPSGLNAHSMELAAGATNALSPNSAFTLIGNATLRLNNFDQTIASLAGVASQTSGELPTVDLGTATLTTGGDNSNTDFKGVISGTGKLAKTGTGTMILSGVNTYSGGTFLNGGVVAISSDANLGGTSGGLTFNGGTLRDTNAGLLSLSSTRSITLNGAGGTFDVASASGILSISSDMAGFGGLTKIGAGTLRLSGVNTYSGSTYVNGGIVSISAENNLGSLLASLVLNGGTLQSRSGFVVLSSTRTITLGGAGGTFDVGSGFPDALSVLSSISGSGDLTKTGGGELSLISTNTYNGATNIEAGVLSISNNHAIPNGSAVTIAAGAALAVGASETIGSLAGAGSVYRPFASGSVTLITGTNNTSTVFSGVISNGPSIFFETLSLTKVGIGTLTLEGVNSYKGVTEVNGGTLIVNGSIAQSILTTVNTGGALGGNGIVGDTVVDGALAPGNSIGLLTVQGNLVLTAAARYMVEISPANADRVNVTGTATVSGATVNATFAAGSYVSKQYTIVNATGGVVGQFGAQVNTNLPAGFHSSLSYGKNDVYLNLAMDFVPPPNNGLAGNQQNVANAIVGFFNSNGGIPIVFGGLTPDGLRQVSGETATGSQQNTFNAMTQFMGVMTDPWGTGRTGSAGSSGGISGFADEGTSSAFAASHPPRSKREREAYAAVYNKAPPVSPSFDQRWNVWAAGFGGSQTTDGNASVGSGNTTSRFGAVAAGAEYALSRNTVVGFALAGGGTSFSVANAGSGRSDLFQAGALIRHVVGPVYLSGALAYGWQNIITDRTVTIAGIDRLRAEFNANAWSGRAEGGYRFAAYGVGLTPYAAGQFTTFDLPAYAEQVVSGANTFALGYAAKQVTAARSELGFRVDRSFAMQGSILTLRGRAAWAHDYGNARAATATFQTLPGASFVVNGAAPASHAALATASAELAWRNGLSLGATFEGEFSSVTRSYAGKGVVRYAW